MKALWRFFGYDEEQEEGTKLLKNLYTQVTTNPIDQEKLSIILLSAAHLAAPSYKDIEKAFVNSFEWDLSQLEQQNPDLSQLQQNLENNASKHQKSIYFQTWLLGRLLVARQTIFFEEKERPNEQLIKNIASLLEEYLSNHIPEDTERNYYTWTLCYLNIYYAQICSLKKYDAITLKTNQSLNVLKRIKPLPQADISWAQILNLYSASRAHDEIRYKCYLKQITANKNSQIGTSLKHLYQKDNYYAWSCSLIRLAALYNNDFQTFDLMKESQKSPQYNNEFDRLLAISTLDLTNRIYEVMKSDSGCRII